jgi:hypothetical protein
VIGVNYTETFIVVAPDCPVAAAQTPPARYRGAVTVAAVQFEMIHDHPYRYTQEDVQFASAQRRPGAGTDDDPVPASAADREQLAAAKAEYLAQPLPCLRSSPLAKRYGWGLHFDSRGGVATVPVGSAEYDRLAAGDGGRVVVLTAFRSRRAES